MINAISKNRQSYEILEQMTKNAFGEKIIGKEMIGKSLSFVEMEGGFCNVVYQVSLEGKESYIVKIAPSNEVVMMAYEKEILATEVEVLRRIAMHTEIPAPRVVYYDSSRTVCDAPYFFMTKMEGTCFDKEKDQLSSEEIDSVLYELGQYNRQINEITNGYFGLPGVKETYSNDNKEFMLRLFQMVLEDGMKAGSDLKYISYEGMWELLLASADVFLEVTTPRLVHWDLWDGNVFIQNGTVSGIIDYERCMWADPLMEHEFSGMWPPRKAFIEGYGKSEFTKGEQLRCSYYRLYRYLTMMVEGDYRKYEDDGLYQWIVEIFKEELKTFRELSV